MMWWFQKKIDKLQDHHIIPISISWPDVKQNIANISESKHLELHRILDMNSRLHYKLVRTARQKTNHKLIMWPEDLKYRHDAQELYFERIPRLDWFLRKLHLEKMNDLVNYESWRIEKLWIKHTPEIATNFITALENYHDLWLQLSKEIQIIFKKWLSLNQ
jgi:hypothetical protein